MNAACYVSHFYCDVPGCTGDRGVLPYSAEYTGETFVETVKKARLEGWIINLSGDLCLCTSCQTAGWTMIELGKLE